ncbi:MAG: DegT/DnrJ/EryC1/StrS family aminotransferase [Termitinemataceae bacterium]|nr:MAG: DegT/DnrJ/EryC1/StrS family aminotransferase [Termitinemataceae bacterium]
MIEVYSPSIKRKEMDAVLTVLVEEKIGPGEQGQRLIQYAKEYSKFDFCIALRSPVFALDKALSLLNLDAGSGVAISALSPAYYLKVIADLGLKAVIFDTLAASPFPNADNIQAAIDRVKDEAPIRAIVLHHCLGYMPKMDDVNSFGIPLIEDCSTAVGSGFGIAEGGSAGSRNQGSEGAGEGGGAVSHGDVSDGGVDGIKNNAERVETPLDIAGSFGVFTILGLEERDMLTSGGGALLYAAERRNGNVLRNAEMFLPEYELPDMNAAMAIVQFREAQKNAVNRRLYANAFTQSALQQRRHKLFVQSDNFYYNNYAFALVLETGMKEVTAWAKRKEIVVENAFAGTIIGRELIPPEFCPNAYSLSLRTALFPIYPRLGGANAKKIEKLIQTLP